jgi:hypothetical protein
MSARTGAGAPHIETFAAVATARTARGVPTATTHQRQPTRQRIIRAPRSRKPVRPSVREMTTSAATSGPPGRNGTGARPKAQNGQRHQANAIARPKKTTSRRRRVHSRNGDMTLLGDRAPSRRPLMSRQCSTGGPTPDSGRALHLGQG